MRIRHLVLFFLTTTVGFLLGYNWLALPAHDAKREYTGPNQVIRAEYSVEDKAPSGIPSNLRGDRSPVYDTPFLKSRRGLFEMQQWMFKSPDDAWRYVLSQKDRLSEKDYQSLIKQAQKADAFVTSKEYSEMLSRWSGADAKVFSITTTANRDTNTLTRILKNDPQRDQMLQVMAESNPVGDWLQSTEFLISEAGNSTDAAAIIDRALSRWMSDEGPETAGVWLASESRGPEFDRSKRWIAAKLFAQDPKLALQLVSTIAEPTQREAAVMQLAQQSTSESELAHALDLGSSTTRALFSNAR